MRRKIFIERSTGKRVVWVSDTGKTTCLVEEEGGYNLREVAKAALEATNMLEEPVAPVQPHVLSPWEERRRRREESRNDEYAYDFVNGFYNYYK